MPDSCSRSVLCYANEVVKARRDFGSIRRRQMMYIRWVPPPVGWFKLNVDGATKGVENIAGCRGLIRGADGRWVAGFAKKLGACSAIKAELWAVLTGLQLAVNLHMSQLIVESDLIVVIQLLKCLQEGMEETDGMRLLSDIGRELSKLSMLKFVHVYRESNSSADSLAYYSFAQEDLFAVFDKPPDCLYMPLFQDVMGVTHPRSILTW